jgi:hypothetical protein
MTYGLSAMMRGGLCHVYCSKGLRRRPVPYHDVEGVGELLSIGATHVGAWAIDVTFVDLASMVEAAQRLILSPAGIRPYVSCSPFVCLGPSAAQLAIADRSGST